MLTENGLKKKIVNALQGAPATAPEISVIHVTDFLLSQN